MTNHDDIQRDLQALLAAANPSPAFAAAVRTRVAGGAARRSRRAAWAWTLGGAVGLASFTWALMAREPAVASIPRAAVMVSVAGVQPQVQRTPAQAPERASRSQTSRRARQTVPLARAGAVAVDVEAADTYVLVPDDQRIALVNLLRRVHQGRATVPAGVVAAYDKDGLLVPPEPIVIAPLPDPAALDPDDKGATVDPKGPAKDKQ